MNNVIEALLNADDLPSPPAVAFQLLEMFPDPDVNIKAMSKLIGADPVLAGKLIAYCNSPMFARTRGVDTVHQAIMNIGLRATKILALSFSLVDTIGMQNSGFDLDQFWSRSLATAVAARTIAESQNRDGGQEFLLGLMLAIGQLGFAHGFPKRYAELVALSAETGVALGELESAEWSLNHLELGVEMLTKWDFPDELVAALALAGKQSTEDAAEQIKDCALTLKLAQKMSAILLAREVEQATIDQCKSFANETFGVDSDAFASLFDSANEAWCCLADVFRVDSSHSESFASMEKRARKGVVEISMGLHAENTVVGEQNAKLKINATVDSLTGVKNRRGFDEEVPNEWERAKRLQKPFVVIMVDIDHFKKVNDTFGHAAGDSVLVLVGQQLKNQIRKYDSVYRFGGEEFVIVAHDCLPQDVVLIAERIRKAIELLDISLSDGSKIKITASFGVAIHSHDNPGSLEQLLEAADKMLYEAKKNGRNQVCKNFDLPNMPTPCLPTVQVQPRQSADLI